MARSLDVTFDSFVNVPIPDDFDECNEEHVAAVYAAAREKYLEMLREGHEVFAWEEYVE